MACFKCGNAVEAREPTAYTDGLRPPTQVSQSNANLLDDKWLLVEKIGAGGMGTVWLAKDTVLDRKVAVKILSESLATLPEYIERFEREARVMASLDHPNLITLFAVGRRANQPYMVMKFLDGQPLAKLLNPRLTPAMALPLFRQMCDGLQAMHARHILHRDVKPANLFVSPTGHLTVLDLGIARQVGSTLTKTGIMFGTPAYMSPEQIAGDKTLDSRTDIYSAGAVLYEMLTGRTPFEADEEHSLLLAHIQQPPPDASQTQPDVPRALSIAIQRALSKRPADRFTNITEFYDAVAASLGAAPLKPDFAPKQGGTEKGTRELVPRPDDDENEPSTTPALYVQARDTVPGQPTPVPVPVRRPSNPAALRAQKAAAASGPNAAYRGSSGANPALKGSGAARTRSKEDHPSQGTQEPPIAPDAPTPKGHEAPIDLQVTRPGRQALQLPLPPPSGMHLGPRILIGAAVTAFVLLAGYFMLRVIAATPAEDQKAVLIPGKIVLKQADDTPVMPRRVEDAMPPMQETLKTVDGNAADLAKMNNVGAQASVIKTDEELAREDGSSSKSSRPPPSRNLRKSGGGELRLTATYNGLPIAATVFLAGKMKGKTPIFLRMSTGVYKLKLLYPNVDPVEIEMLFDTKKGHDFEMELGDGNLDVNPLLKDVVQR